MGIWTQLNEDQHQIQKQFQLSAGEGNTPIQLLAIDGRDVLLKREDKNPTGSHKDRGLAFQISAHLQEGEKNFVISSSGNSSISAINLLKGREESLIVFLSPNLSNKKRARLREVLGGYIDPEAHLLVFGNITLKFSHRAVSDAFKYAQSNSYTLLRGSTDIYGTFGYTTIAHELYEVRKDISDIFIPTSSGTTAVGIYDGYQLIRKDDNNFSIPRFHICQTEKVNTLVRDLYPNRIRAKRSLADSIVDRVGHRQDEVLEIIQKTKGEGWIIGDEELIKAKETLQKQQIDCSFEGALTLASMLRNIDNGDETKVPLLIISGTI